MNRRHFLKISGGGVLCMACCSRVAYTATLPQDTSAGYYHTGLEWFYKDRSGDIFIDPRDVPTFKSTLARIKRVQAKVGYGNFNLLGFTEMLRTGARYADVGEFHADEIRFMERVFYGDAAILGFLGGKVVTDLHNTIAYKDVARINGSGGHYLFKGEPLNTFQRARAAVGNDLVLTSGVRGVAKQIYLFLNKVDRTNGNLSRASRSVAPPGYSYHGVSDFDIGQKGLGFANFTEAFSYTETHRRLFDQGLVEYRYPAGNPYGVRYEPWHIKITA